MRQLPRSIAAAVLLLVLAACGTEPGPGGASTPVPAPPTQPRPVSEQRTAKDGGLECPATISDRLGTTVPAKPQGIDGRARLLPDRVPISLVDCAYPVLDTMATTPVAAPYPLARRTLVPADRTDEVVQLLTWAPRGDGRNRACTAMGGNETVHLLGARYDDAIVWVASLEEPNACATATNGDFVSPLAAGSRLGQWFDSRSTHQPDGGACAPWTGGRLGDDLSLAPAGDPVVRVCRSTTAGEQARELTADQSRQVVQALRALRTRTTEHGCTGGDPAAGRDFRLVLDYARGNDVVINVMPSCAPPLMSGALESVDATPVVDLVERWSPPTAGYDPDGSVSSSATG